MGVIAQEQASYTAFEIGLRNQTATTTEMDSRTRHDTRNSVPVPTVPRGLIDQSKIRASVRKAERALAPDVIRIMYSVAVDWKDEHSLFFRIVISDSAASPSRLRETTQRIMNKVLQEIRAHELGLQTYFNFRSKSEQAVLREPSWERS